MKELSLVGREKVLGVDPEFDFCRAKRVRRLELDFSNDEVPAPSLHLALECENGENRFELTLLLGGVRELVVPHIHGPLFLPELEVEDVRARMLQGISYELVSHFDRSFRCSCSDLVVLGFEAVDR